MTGSGMDIADTMKALSALIMLMMAMQIFSKISPVNVGNSHITVYPPENPPPTEEGKLTIYADQTLTSELSYLNWGYVEPNSTNYRYAYLKNTYDFSIKLSMNTTSWNPSNATNYMLFDWNCTNYDLASQNVVCALLTLTIYSNTTESGIVDFSFNINVYCEELP
jgi:hypothetical protein